MKNTMLARIATAAALAAALGGCGETDEPPQKRAATTPAPTVTPDPAAGSFPARPQVIDKFDDDGSGWPRDGYRDGAFVLPARGSAAVLAPKRIEPATRGTLSEVIAEPARGGAAGLLCRASADGGTGYALLLDSNSTVRLLRLEDGKAKVLKQHRLTPNERSDPGKPSLLRLGCGTGKPGQPITLIYAINATPFGYVTDRASVDPGAQARVGLLARDGTARFDDFALYLAGLARRSELDFEPVVADLDSGAQHRVTLGRVLEQHRVRVVDVDEDHPRAREPAEDLQRPTRAGERHVTHLAGGAVGDAEARKLVVAPERAVDEHDVTRGEAADDVVVEAREARHVGQHATGRVVPEHEPRRLDVGAGPGEVARRIAAGPERLDLE